MRDRETWAQELVEMALAELPPELQKEARNLPVIITPRPEYSQLDSDMAPDILGLFIGEAHAERGSTLTPLPPQIFLFTDNIWDFCEGDPECFAAEVRITYLHELGHYFGWDEIDLANRSLDYSLGRNTYSKGGQGDDFLARPTR